MGQTEQSGEAQRVAEYYNRNTRRFLRYGGSRDMAAIHRQIWAPGVGSAGEAFLYLNRLVAGAIEPLLATAEQPLVIDLGCGVGGTATWLAQQLGTMVIGVTNSPVQRGIAEERAERLGLEGKCRFLLADFTALPQIGPAQAAYAIEAFLHAADPRGFFEQAVAQLVRGGRLALCDDFLAHSAAELEQNPRAKSWLKRFRRNWHALNLLDAGSVVELAEWAGFSCIQTIDLTAYVRGFHPALLYTVATLTSLPLRWSYWENLSGGAALQVCIRSGWTRYQALIFEKEG